ncbi:autotransporter domain-containing protein [Persicimonas caeni]|uniref:Autotransporter domain-containing protein n=1 Tax=Persicimonas caeni TaxID=2292766 RepID=A0A4Y6PW78_PERCE|nr:autotransporter domain-containing protein [Persicimonas caeni]QDG52568.1 autotransporter domain-containing protein [Persicimonas caeni]QED33790.1 autotransporter domain-containing protein [Persicimonas caeni]
MLAKRKLILSVLVVLAVLLSAGSAFADGVGSTASAKKQTRLMSVTFSPVHLLFPIVELTGEFKADDNWGAAIIGGYGSLTQNDGVLGEQTYDVWEVGGQFRYYALGDFDHGLQVGGEVLYVNVSNDIETSSGTVSGTGEGVAVGPFIGYKIATDLGFTFDGQLGYQRVGIGAEAKNESSGDSVTDESSDWGPLLNLNIGWSF